MTGLRIGVVVTGIWAASGCSAPPSVDLTSYELNSHKIRVARDGIQTYVDSTGNLPDSLEQTCPSMNPRVCEWLPGDYAFEDLWHQRFVYTRFGDEYEIRSLGPDGTRGTSDDVVLNTVDERDLAESVAGCYEIRASGWPPLPEGRFQLGDEEAGAFGVFEAAAPEIEYHSGPVWKPMGKDSIAVSWMEVHSSLQLRLEVRRDSLVGHSAVGTGFASWWGREEESVAIVAVRGTCSSPLSRLSPEQP